MSFKSYKNNNITILLIKKKYLIKIRKNWSKFAKKKKNWKEKSITWKKKW